MLRSVIQEKCKRQRPIESRIRRRGKDRWDKTTLMFGRLCTPFDQISWPPLINLVFSYLLPKEINKFRQKFLNFHKHSICMYNRELRVNKREILSFIDEREIITPYDLMEWFDYTYSYACKKLSLLKKQGLVFDLGNTPSTYRGQWCLTNKGHERLYYLQGKTQKHEIEKEKAEETERQLRRLRKRVESLESHPWIIYEELAPISKQLCGVLRPMAIIETRKLPHDVLPYRTKFNRLLVEAEGIIKRLPEEARTKVEALLFRPDELRLFFP